MPKMGSIPSVVITHGMIHRSPTLQLHGPNLWCMKGLPVLTYSNDNMVTLTSTRVTVLYAIGNTAKATFCHFSAAYKKQNNRCKLLVLEFPTFSTALTTITHWQQWYMHVSWNHPPSHSTMHQLNLLGTGRVGASGQICVTRLLYTGEETVLLEFIM